MTDLPHELAREFRPGYKLCSPTKTGRHMILNPNGEIVRLEDGRPVVVANLQGHHHERRVRQQLAEAGVIAKPRKRRSSKLKAEPTKIRRGQAEQNPFLLAQHTLRDPHASGKERALARHLLAAYQKIENLRKLAKVLGERAS